MPACPGHTYMPAMARTENEMDASTEHSQRYVVDILAALAKKETVSAEELMRALAEAEFVLSELVGN